MVILFISIKILTKISSINHTSQVQNKIDPICKYNSTKVDFSVKKTTKPKQEFVAKAR